MLDNYKISKRITASSTVLTTKDGVEQRVLVAQMTASIGEDGRPNVTKSVLDKEVFKANAEAVLADFAEFERKVFLEEAE